MALVIEWYDFVCFGIVGAAFLGALWVLYRKEGGGTGLGLAEDDEQAALESVLLGKPKNRPKSHVGTDRLWTSCWKGIHPGWLLGTRFISFLVMAGVLSWDIVVNTDNVFIYYTEWTFAVIMVYFGLGTIVSAHGCWLHSTRKSSSENRVGNGFPRRDLEESVPITSNNIQEPETNGTKSRNGYSEEEFLHRAGFWGYLMQVAYQASAGAVVITDTVFWCIIVPFLSIARLRLNWLMGCMHTLNVFFLLLDTGLNNLPFPWFRIAYFMLFSCAYVLFEWVIHASGFSWWPYPFIELNTPWAPLWYFALAVLHIPCYGIYALIEKAKYAILPRLFPHAFVRLN
ncbi:uncharacterized protein LOC116214062 [Punica granatum]|uniref:Uncharacterized protein n=2 Tax=Punica granatum TaxID=22663 RepID=A0A2I0L848_PUNGR|nr:uncharacterized protein LOC116214062 [Punica granatum]PKI76877.1 hypothetical protein CRG98_002863 [Punica granatum]